MRIFAISKSATTQSLTPQTLLKYVKQKGVFPKFTYDKTNDKALSQLNILAQNYRQSLSLNDKTNLLKQEREVLYEELQNPELTLARNYEQIKKMKLTKEDKKNITDYLTLFNVIALNRIDALYKPFNQEFTKEGEAIVKNALNKIDEKSPVKKELMKYFDMLLKRYKKILHPEENLAENKNYITLLQENYNQPKILKHILVKATLNEEEKNVVKDIINRILVSENADEQMMQYAIWGAGKYRTDEAFAKIKEIALNKDEKDVRKREFAMHSVARYLREKTDEVHLIMEKVIEEENSIFSDLAKIINDKINGKYYTKKDRELDYFGFDDSMKKNFKKYKAKIFESEKPLSIKRQNALDRNLILFYDILECLVDNKFKFYIQEDTVTKILKNFVGKRDFQQGLYNSGGFNDSYDGICNPEENYNIININEIESWLQGNFVSHENAHIYHDLFPTKFKNIVHKLYKQALKENRVLDFYAATNEYEYLAQGFEAFSSIYKPHETLLDVDSNSNTLFKLISKDPDLYKFIQEITGYEYA